MGSPRRILVPCIDRTSRDDAVRKLYRHVDVLNANGIDAVVMHQEPGFRCTWFENQTAVSSYGQIAPRPTDIVLVPEILAWQFVTLAPGVPKIVFSQNAYQTFAGRTEQYNVNPYLHADFRAVIVGSEDSRAYLQYVFPAMKVFRIRHSVDPHLFSFGANKKPTIAFMPRKEEKDAIQVLAILRFRELLGGWFIAQVHDKTEAETAHILRDAAIFLNFRAQEGWGLPPMEAMASGCVTIGYDGRGGAEYFRPPHATPIKPEDISEFAAATERAIRDFEAGPQAVLDRTAQASRFIHENYPPEVEADDIVTTWSQIFELLQVGP